MIKSFHHKGLQLFFETGSKAGIQSSHAPRLARQLAKLNEASSWEDINLPGWRLHLLKGKLVGHFSILVGENWRLTFKVEGEDAVLVNYQDYH
ncbi:type II toxin-antitoxin system RelE/ParE family toxin [Polynucleobacter sp. MWH-Berg-3C6]|uniref:type II toxin-antitoxin system RelE/ParE family toxin n=1 Tax=Polynucleobacter sp. MWH-Berg-3C6 TaxID=1855882 RepID=UPI001C0BC987|nr:type II toxin-antitoxin system RelE/ParE family toxin [Polynucleobacter sp. MWH-Berg-3C6]MBU3551416.1 type II toxin-antitoxin system RelE/ParE family toxin [Polynucleobacter sp. MWH-Berg-3C6]